MDIDVVATIRATERSVETRQRDGRPAKVVTASRTYDTTVEDLWDALTSAERIPRWFLPISGDLQLGGRYQLEGNAGGQITQCEPPSHFAVTWEYGGEVSWLEVTVEATANGGARLRLEHIAFIPDGWWNQYGPGATGVGWDLGLMGLGLYLSTGEDNDPKAAEAWTLSDQGKAFVRGCSDDWGRASIAAGTDPAAALASAELIRAFYTGETADVEGAGAGGGEGGDMAGHDPKGATG